MSVQRSTFIFACILLLPAVLYVLAIVAYPLVDTFILSFTDASLRKTTNWVGWANYEKIFNERFAEVIIRTFIWTFFSVALKMVIGTFGATHAECRGPRPLLVPAFDHAAMDRADGDRHLHVGLDV